MASSEDRRVRKTRKALYDALAELLLTKPISDISVREISDLADINRGTFYLHYRDVYDMVDKLQDEIFEKFNLVVNSYEPDKYSDELFPMLVEIFNLLAEHSKLAKVLMSKNGDAAFVDKLKNLIHEKCFAKVDEKLKLKTNISFNYFYQYIISGCIGIFGEWLNSGMRESPSEMADITEKLVLTGITSLT